MRSTVVRLVIALTIMAFAGMAHAQATRTWVSGVGDDANPCSRTAPCKTFAGAISKTASGGEINTLDPAGYGTVTITKPITIDGGGNLSSVLNSGVNGIIINTPGASDVVNLRNLEVNGANTGVRGISILAAKRVTITNCNIYGQNAVAPNGQGININSSSLAMFVEVLNCQIHSNSTQGIAASASGAGSVLLSVENSDITYNGASGIDLGAGSKGHVSHCYLTANGSAGVSVGTASSTADVADSFVNFNVFGFNATGGSIHLFGNQITQNSVSLQTAGGGVVQSHGNNAVQNNATNTLPTATVPAGTQ